MTHYSRTWNCIVCDERQESIDIPKMQVCEVCLSCVAQRLCKQTLKASLDTPGVDKEYWLRQADSLVSPMMQRYRKPSPKETLVAEQRT